MRREALIIFMLISMLQFNLLWLMRTNEKPKPVAVADSIVVAPKYTDIDADSIYHY